MNMLATPIRNPSGLLRCGWRPACLLLALTGLARAEEPGSGPTGSDRERAMAERGLVRHDGAWRTPQEVEIITRTAREAEARREWSKRLERLRADLVRPAGAERAAEEIREISDPLAVPALAAALGVETDRRARGLYVQALSRIDSGDAFAMLVATALDHADPETRIAAVERLVAVGPQHAEPALVAALASPDNARVNRAAEALGRLGRPSAVGPLVASLETRHVVVAGSGPPEGATSATFTPAGGGLSMGGGPKRVAVPMRNDRVLEALVALTGRNFEWDVAAWRGWLAERESPPPDYDPRRGMP